MKILGIDPGIASVGCAVVGWSPGQRPRLVHHESINTRARDSSGDKVSDGHRLLEIEQRLSSLLDSIQPAVVVYESIYQGMGRRGETTQAVRIGKVIGLLERLAAARDIKIVAYAPTSVFSDLRKIAGLHGHTYQGQTRDRSKKKRFVQRVIQVIFSLDEKRGSHHEADAAAVTLCYLWREYQDDVKADLVKTYQQTG